MKENQLPINNAPLLTDFARMENASRTISQVTTWQKIKDLFGGGKYDLIENITGVPDGSSMTATISGGVPPYTFLQWEQAQNNTPSQSLATPLLATSAVTDTNPLGSTALFRAKAMDSVGNIVIEYFLNTTIAGPPPLP